MNKTSWLIGQNPILAGGMVTTGDDYDLFLRKYLRCALTPVCSPLHMIVVQSMVMRVIHSLRTLQV